MEKYYVNEENFEAIREGLSTLPSLYDSLIALRICHNNIRELVCPPNLIDLRACDNGMIKIKLNDKLQTAILDNNKIRRLKIPASVYALSIKNNHLKHVKPPATCYFVGDENPWIKSGEGKMRSLQKLCLDKCVELNLPIPPWIKSKYGICMICCCLTHRHYYRNLHGFTEKCYNCDKCALSYRC